MTNHPNRSKGPYTATIGGGSWAQGPTTKFDTIRACRLWAEEHGDSADYCSITDRRGLEIARHQRDPSTGKWYRAQT